MRRWLILERRIYENEPRVLQNIKHSWDLLWNRSGGAEREIFLLLLECVHKFASQWWMLEMKISSGCLCKEITWWLRDSLQKATRRRQETLHFSRTKERITTNRDVFYVLQNGKNVTRNLQRRPRHTAFSAPESDVAYKSNIQTAFLGASKIWPSVFNPI